MFHAFVLQSKSMIRISRLTFLLLVSIDSLTEQLVELLKINSLNWFLKTSFFVIFINNKINLQHIEFCLLLFLGFMTSK